LRLKLFLLFASFIICTCSLLAQDSLFDLPSKLHSKVNWSVFDEQAPSKEKALEFLFRNPNHYCGSKNFGITDSIYFSGYHSKNIHLIDIDNDKDFDIIYDGKTCPGFESGTVNIYLNDSGTYKQILNESGTIIRADWKKNQFLISIHDYPCCSGIQNTITNYEYDKLNKRFNKTRIDFFASCQLYDKEHIPERINHPQNFSCVQDSVYMRWLSSSARHCSNSNFDDKLYVVLSKKSAGELLYISDDHQWGFVVVKYSKNIRVSGTDLPERSSTSIYLYGWIPLAGIKTGK
jgi:hypothetical protein